jgi:GT2 family glycosyltransferase
MIIDGEPPAETLESLRSLGSQIGSRWRLVVVVQRQWEPDAAALIAVSGITRRRFDVETVDRTSTSEDMLAAGFTASLGEDVALIYPGDSWAPDAVAQLSDALVDEGAAYADEDSIDSRGMRVSPRLKPAFSPDYLLHSDYVGRPLAFAGGLVARLPPSSAGVPEARDHDIALRVCDTACTVRHIPEVLCSRRVAPAPLSTDAPGGTDHIAAALGRHHDHATVAPGMAQGTVRLQRTPRTLRTATIVIPFRDEPHFLRACIDSIDRTVGAVSPNYLLVDNGSLQPETLTLLERLDERSDIRVLRDDRPFNWAALNNAAVGIATGDVLLFLNNDIEARSARWLDAICGQAERPDVGAVGARLLYPDLRLQHCGVVLGLGGAAGHVLVGLEESAPGYLAMATTTRECSGVTGACLATRRDVFDKHGPFDESLGIDLNDIDYCLRVGRSGLRVLYESTAEFIHHESPSRGTAGGVRDIKLFIDRWKSSILAGDPYLNENLTRIDSSCALRAPGEEDWWQRWYTGLSHM